VQVVVLAVVEALGRWAPEVVLAVSAAEDANSLCRASIAGEAILMDASVAKRVACLDAMAETARAPANTDLSTTTPAAFDAVTAAYLAAAAAASGLDERTVTVQVDSRLLLVSSLLPRLPLEGCSLRSSCCTAVNRRGVADADVPQAEAAEVRLTAASVPVSLPLPIPYLLILDDGKPLL
jgi:hypothetical protein